MGEQFVEKKTASGPNATCGVANDETYYPDGRGLSEHMTSQSFVRVRSTLDSRRDTHCILPTFKSRSGKLNPPHFSLPLALTPLFQPQPD